MERIKKNLTKKYIKINGTTATIFDIFKLFDNVKAKKDFIKSVILSKKSMYIYTY